jgi:hypothetical protein
VVVISIGSMPFDRAAWLARIADRSTCTTTPLAVDCNGLIDPGDRVVVTNRFVAWLDMTAGATTNTNGGAGMLRGLWPIAVDGAGNYNFVHIVNANNWAPNELLPGANGGRLQGSGASLQMRLINNVDTPDPYSLGAENQENTSITLDGAPICDGGLFSGGGVFVQTQGFVAHFERDLGKLAAHGFSSYEDVNADPSRTSRLRFTVTSRFSPDEPFLRQELSLSVEGDATSPIASDVVSTCALAGQAWSETEATADTATIRNHGVARPACSAPAEIAAGQPTPFDLGVIARRGLDYLESATKGVPGTTWRLGGGGGGRTLGVSLPPGFATPDAMQALLNGYSAPGTGGVCIDVQHSDVNQCGGAPVWPAGFVHTSAIDYSTSGLH